MKFAEERPYASVDAGMQKLLEIANGIEADREGWLHIEKINVPFLALASVAEYTAARDAAIARGYLILHPSGALMKFTKKGADLFA